MPELENVVRAALIAVAQEQTGVQDSGSALGGELAAEVLRAPDHWMEVMRPAWEVFCGGVPSQTPMDMATSGEVDWKQVFRDLWTRYQPMVRPR